MRPEILIIDTILLVLATGLLMQPSLSRRGIFFGVTVDPTISSGLVGRQITKSYRRWIVGLTALGFVMVHSGIVGPPAMLVAAIPLIIGGIARMVASNKRARTLAMDTPVVTSRTASLAMRRHTLPGGWLVFVGPLLIPVLAGLVLWANWSTIPERYPVHWGLDGQPDAWMMKTFGSVFGVLFSAFASDALLLWAAYCIFSKTRQISADRSFAAKEQASKRFSYISLLAAAYGMSIMYSMMVLRSLRGGPSDSRIVWIILLPIVMTITLALYSLRIGQGGTRLPGRGGGVLGDGTPDECWKWGLIYYNPDDPAFLVEKRIGMGWTLNMANRWSWVFSVGILSLPLVLWLINRWIVGE